MGLSASRVAVPIVTCSHPCYHSSFPPVVHVFVVKLPLALRHHVAQGQRRRVDRVRPLDVQAAGVADLAVPERQPAACGGGVGMAVQRACAGSKAGKGFYAGSIRTNSSQKCHAASGRNVHMQDA